MPDISHSAGVVLVNQKGEVLLQHREKKESVFYPGYWGYPAGSVKEGEDFEAAAKRELAEKAGYRADVLHSLVEEDYVRTDGELVQRHVYLAVYDDAQPITRPETKFIPIYELYDKKMVPGQERICRLAVAEAQARKLIPA